jgi:hypothetical protein
MPSKTDSIALGDKFLKRNVKLLDCQKEMIKHWYSLGHSINALARMFKVNKRTIQFILFPERLERNKKLREQRGGTKIYYDKDKHREATKEHRNYKKQVLK